MPVRPPRAVWKFGAAGLFLALAALLLVFLQPDFIRTALRDRDMDGPPRFVGSEVCAACHQREATPWRASHHAKAMTHASDKTVLGDFKDARFEYFGVTSRMFRQGAKFMIETDGPDGKMETFEVKYTFGLDPLQQYLVEFRDGRVQALSIAWDSRPRERGGQRWFHLYPLEKVDHNDVLHWTGLNQNWNFMCAECHSTGVRKNYDAANDTFRTTFAEMVVGCEACHGQGSRHAAWARSQSSPLPFARENDQTFGLLVRYAERLNATWPLDPASGAPKRSVPPASLRTEVESCGNCHGRRGQISEDWIPGRWLSDTHAVSSLTRGLYDAAGQMEDEVFNYGSFKQSKMFAAGVTCSDCHDPHSAKLRIAGDGVCLQCHLPEKFAVPAHHRHEGAEPAVTCVNCHMPVRTYMVVDNRHDHSFRIPRPDVTALTGAPNACNDCHGDKGAEWAANAVELWHGKQPKGFQTYAEAFSAARSSAPDASRKLLAVANDRASPSIARATALTELAAHASPAVFAAARAALAHPDPMVRIGALDALEGAPPQQAWPIAAPMLSDPVRGVRLRAALLLSALPAGAQPAADRRAFERAADEFVAAQKLNADRPESRSGLGAFYARQGRFTEAEAEYRAAIRLSAQFAPAYVNLADLYRQTGREAESRAILSDGLRAAPDNAALLHAFGLSLVRAKAPPDEAIEALARAAALAPDNARYGFVHGVALHSSGRLQDALKSLQKVVERHPGDRETLAALVGFEQEAGNFPAALAYAERLSAIMPEDATLRRLVGELKKRASQQAQ
ncbi:MAG: tetratricopeptide repeat protein [Beijerinckiaceae bacterium]